MNKTLTYLVFFLCASYVGLGSTNPQYIIIGIFFLPLLIGLIGKRKLNFKLESWLDIIPFVMLLAWVYGLILGIYNSNNPVGIMRNFFGMSFYSVFIFLFFFKPDKKEIYKAIVWASLVNIVYAFYFSSQRWLGGFLGGSEAITLTDLYRSYYSVGVLILLPVLSVLIAGKFTGNHIFFSQALLGKNLGFYIPVFIIFLALVGTTASKGFFLIFMLIFIMLALILVAKSLLVNKLYRSAWSFAFLSLVFFSIVLFTINFIPQKNNLDSKNIISTLIYTYSGRETSNSIRNEQRKYLVNEYSFFGAGLGATLKSGYKRDDLGYGFELSYENVIHKFGFISIFILFGLFLPLVVSIKNILIKRDIFYSSVAFGLMGYLVPAYGNPMLFSPICVLMHCLAIYFLRNSK